MFVKAVIAIDVVGASGVPLGFVPVAFVEMSSGTVDPVPEERKLKITQSDAEI